MVCWTSYKNPFFIPRCIIQFITSQRQHVFVIKEKILQFATCYSSTLFAIGVQSLTLLLIFHWHRHEQYHCSNGDDECKNDSSWRRHCLFDHEECLMHIIDDIFAFGNDRLLLHTHTTTGTYWRKNVHAMGILKSLTPHLILASTQRYLFDVL